LFQKLEAPGVEVHCLYGTDIKTEESYVYAAVKSGKNWYDAGPTSVTFGDGDGTVSIRSLLGCQPWSKQQKAPVYLQNFTGAEHLGILGDDRLLKYIGKAVTYEQL